jgi:menaquinone-dependent protoporphyrinogen IX oxidase
VADLLEENIMSRILILFTSIDGQAARVAERIAASVRRAGHEATLMRADAPASIASSRRTTRS